MSSNGIARVGVHPVDLRRHPLGPAGAELRDRHAGVEQQRAPRARPGLRQHLRREHAEREARVHQVGGQALDGPGAAGEDLAGEAELFGIGQAVVDRAERAPVE